MNADENRLLFPLFITITDVSTRMLNMYKQ